MRAAASARALLRQRSAPRIFGATRIVEVSSPTPVPGQHNQDSLEIRRRTEISANLDHDDHNDNHQFSSESSSTTNDQHVSATRTLFPRVSDMLPTTAVRTLDAGIQHFLPRGYTTGSVPLNYFRYTKWSVLASIATSAGMVLSTQSLLYAIGLGAGAIPTAAALNWVLKDGLGQLGGVLFASLVNNHFDSDPKRWRLVASVALDSAVLLQALTPLAPSLFLPVAALANVGMNVSWLAASASRAGIHLSFTTGRSGMNIADITAKAGSQTTFASTVGMACGVLLSTGVGSSPELILPTLAVLSALHLTCTYQCLLHVTLNTLNNQRAEHVAYEYVMKKGRQHCTVEEAAKSEIVVGAYGKHLALGFESPRMHQSRLEVNGDLETYVGGGNGGGSGESGGAIMERLCQSFKERKYAILLMKEKRKVMTTRVGLFVGETATSHDVLLGHLQATKMRQLLESIQQKGGAVSESQRDDIAQEAESWLDEVREDYLSLLVDHGWNIDNVFLEEDTARRVTVSSVPSP